MADTLLLTQLRQLLTTRFGDGDLRTLCFDLGMDYDNLPGQGKADKARELVTHMDQHDRLADLVRMGRQSRPDVPWPDIGTPPVLPVARPALPDYKPSNMPPASQTEDGGEDKVITVVPKTGNVTSPNGRELGCSGVVGAFGFRFQGWYRQLPDVAKAATITGIVGVLVALCGLTGTLGSPIVQEWARTIFAQASSTPTINATFAVSPTPSLTPAPTWTPSAISTSTQTPTAASTWTPLPSATRPASPAAATATPTPTPRPQTIIVSDRVNLRAGPGTGYPSVGLADRGELFTIVGKNAEPPTWWQVDRGNEQKAWISAGFVDIIGSVATVPIVVAPPPPPAPMPRILYDWSSSIGWACWDQRYDESGQSHGTAWTPENGAFKVDFSTASGNVGQLMYRGVGPGCPELTIPATARIYAQVQLLVAGAPVNAEIFMQSTGWEPWYAGRPRVLLADGAQKTLSPDRWVTGPQATAIERTGQQFVTLGIEFNLGGAAPSPGEQRFLIKRVWVTER